MFDKKLLDMIVCPVSRTPLVPDEERQELLSPVAGLAFPVRDGIPALIEEEARALTPDEIARLRAR